MANDSKDFLRISQFDTAVSCECHMDDDRDMATIALCLAHLFTEEPKLFMAFIGAITNESLMERVRENSIDVEKLFSFKNNKNK